MKIKTAEATPLQLDWLVAKCEGIDADTPVGTPYFLVIADKDVWGERRVLHPDYGGEEFSPSTNWSQGGPIIELRRIKVIPVPVGIWRSPLWENNRQQDYYGQTPLIAAMRCYVASKLGDEVEVPEELQ